MTLEDAIIHAEEVAEGCQLKACDIERNDYKDLEKCADEHRQLAKWLKELKELRERNSPTQMSGTSDMISRQAAIDGLDVHYVKRINLNDWQDGWNAALNWMENVYLDELPSAQPEIIRCKDCEHHYIDMSGTYYCGRKEYGYGWGLNDFCSDAERRTTDEL